MNHFTPQCTGQELCFKEKKKKPLIICSGISATSRCTEPASKWSLYSFALLSFSTAVCKSLMQLKRRNKQKKAQLRDRNEWEVVCVGYADRITYSLCVCAAKQFLFSVPYHQLWVPTPSPGVRPGQGGFAGQWGPRFVAACSVGPGPTGCQLPSPAPLEWRYWGRHC